MSQHVRNPAPRRNRPGRRVRCVLCGRGWNPPEGSDAAITTCPICAPERRAAANARFAGRQIVSSDGRYVRTERLSARIAPTDSRDAVLEQVDPERALQAFDRYHSAVQAAIRSVLHSGRSPESEVPLHELHGLLVCLTGLAARAAVTADIPATTFLDSCRQAYDDARPRRTRSGGGDG